MDTNNWIIENATTAYNDFWSSSSCRYWGWPVSYQSPNSTEQAFAVAKQLIEDKVVECRTSKQFIELVDTIKKAL